MNKITDLSQTIVALTTGLGTGSIAVIRLSGNHAISIVNNVFDGKNLDEVSANTIHFGKIFNETVEIDQVVVSIFRSPNSYTGEDIVEISCHANALIVRQLIDILISGGAQYAGPGEFTMRAFLNGKMDLAQAEAVSDLISAKTQHGVENSINQLEGGLTGYIGQIKEKLIEVLGLLEIDLDFAEEGLEVVSPKQISRDLDIILEKIMHLSESYNQGKWFTSSINLVLAGEPNAGKSTLMNLLLGEDRAITSHHPGTTRDVIQEHVIIENTYFKLSDTAGLRTTHDELESEGINRTRTQLKNADVVLLVVDVSQPDPLNAVADQLPTAEHRSNYILVANKMDLGINEGADQLLEKSQLPVVYTSAITGIGLAELKKTIISTVNVNHPYVQDEIVISSGRHKEILQRAITYLNRAQRTLDDQMGFEFVSVELRESLNVLGEITGETATDDILNQVFRNFCIGK